LLLETFETLLPQSPLLPPLRSLEFVGGRRGDCESESVCWRKKRRLWKKLRRR